MCVCACVYACAWETKAGVEALWFSTEAGDVVRVYCCLNRSGDVFLCHVVNLGMRYGFSRTPFTGTHTGELGRIVC